MKILEHDLAHHGILFTVSNLAESRWRWRTCQPKRTEPELSEEVFGTREDAIKDCKRKIDEWFEQNNA